MPHIVRRPPPDARDLIVDVAGADGISRPRTALKHNATHIFHYSKRDDRQIAIPKADLLPPGMWDLCAFLTAAAEAEGVSVSVLVARFRAEMPEQFEAVTQLAATSQTPSGPDLMESGNHASSSRDRGQDH